MEIALSLDLNWAVFAAAAATGGAPSASSRILTEAGDFIDTEGGDRLVTES